MKDGKFEGIYPMHEKLEKLGGDNQTIGQFIEWLQEQQWEIVARDEDGYMSLPYRDDDAIVYEWIDFAYRPVGLSTEGILERYFDIDRQELMREKDRMLAEIRDQDEHRAIVGEDAAQQIKEARGEQY